MLIFGLFYLLTTCSLAQEAILPTVNLTWGTWKAAPYSGDSNVSLNSNVV